MHDYENAERALALHTIRNAVNDLTELVKESADIKCWAVYEIQDSQKIYTGYERIFLPDETRPSIISGDQFEIQTVTFLLDWYKKRYTQMCVDDYLYDTTHGCY